ncbi:MAG: FAD-dependent oxidoreductase [Chloroflexi bacterium]|mgnify:FL=1|nr:FAD-dependent oxidoreductase [Anaerolineaceae bacterium]NLI44750.1 FAD-dependent oxidoreductase [Chloroflexota bacterium]HOE34999.1 FAD-dependent oxidoreductase [Anaerolineaceae bacterium]HOT25538.1 FAD-dependent oxidoreductase [Anaerolineaceae bacterium]HQK03430.1 FAD-dependent oxidoreductase [Anaerolineaceae bacterium]
MSDTNAETIYDVVIIGGGPAGSTAGIYTARANLSTLILDKGLTTGALGTTSKIANFPGIAGEISGAELLRTIRMQAESFGAKYINDKAIGTDLSANPKLVFGNFGVYSARAVIIATGSLGRSNLIKGEAELLGRGVSYCAVCDAAFFKQAVVAVAGKSDEAVEEALYLSRFASKVYLFSPAPELSAPAELIAELRANPKVELIAGATLREIYGKEHVEGVRFARRGSETEQDLPVKGVFIYLQGGVPITDFLQGQLETSPGGCLIVDREFQTKIPGVFAVGDVLCQHIKQAVIAASDGATAGIAVEKYLRGRSKMGVDWK